MIIHADYNQGAAMSTKVQRPGKQPSRRCLCTQLLCIGIVAGALACAAPVAAGAAEPQLPSVGGGGTENLSVGIYWGLYEQIGSQAEDSVGIVGAPMPFLMQLEDNGEHRLFAFIQHRLPGGPYCAETPAQLEDISVDLTTAAGDATIPGPAYSKTLVWTPTEPGEYTLCAYLDSAATDQPTEINFVQLTADPAPGRLSLAVTSEVGYPERMTVKAEGEAVVPSEVTASVQEQGLSCTLPDGRLAGQLLPELPGSANAGSGSDTVGPGPFTASYAFAAEKPGPYEVCAYLTAAPTEKMYFERPYEVGSADFSVQETPVAPASAQQVTPLVPEVQPAPSLSRVSLSNSHFHVARGRPRATRGAAVGTTFRFDLSETATVTIGITRLLPGGRICEPPRTAAIRTHARRCDRSVAAGSIVRQLTAGGDAVPFNGVIGHRELVAGSYDATVTAHNADGRSRSVTLRFSVAP